MSVVAAAVLAFGTTQTYLRFSGSGPVSGCGAVGCVNPAASPTPSPSPSGGHASHGRSPGVQVSYRTIGSWATGFTGQLTISNHSEHELTRWHLAITYTGSRITDMSGAHWLPRPGGTSGTIEPARPSDPLGAARSVRISYTATGTPHAPAGCDLDGTRCKIR
jgi:endoglucanase